MKQARSNDLVSANALDERKCIKCKTPLFECMGCVLPRDICAAIDGLRPWNKIRELCSICAEVMKDTLATDPLEDPLEE